MPYLIKHIFYTLSLNVNNFIDRLIYVVSDKSSLLQKIVGLTDCHAYYVAFKEKTEHLIKYEPL